MGCLEEKEEPGTAFTSIPAAAWWCVITMTTVGYGDAIPMTVAGKLVASLASIAGILVLAFPVTLIMDNFSNHFRKAPASSMRSSKRNAPKQL